MLSPQMPLRDLCLVILPEVLIAHDLTDMIEDARPDLTVLCAATPDQALPQIAQSHRIAIAFIAQSPTAFAPTPLAARIAREAAHVIYLGHDPHDHPRNTPPVTALPYPFASEDLLAVLPKA